MRHVHLLKPANLAAAEANARGKVERLRRAYQIGVPLAFGTDVTEDLDGRDRGRMTVDFIQNWIDAGIRTLANISFVMKDGKVVKRLP